MLGGEVLGEWQAGLDDLFALIAGRFSRVEPRRLAFAYVRGLLAPLERRNGWTIAEHAGRRSPNAVQEMLYSPCWDPHLVRDDVRDYVVEHLGDPDGVLIGDDTGFVKKGVLCRCRHNTPYADLRIMPRTMLKALVNDSETSGLVGIIRRLRSRRTAGVKHTVRAVPAISVMAPASPTNESGLRYKMVGPLCGSRLAQKVAI
jgi:hypothetical protein